MTFVELYIQTEGRAKAITIVVMLAGCLVLTGCGKKTGTAAPPPPEVAIVAVQPQQVVLTTELPGRISAHLVAEVRPQVSGIVQKRLFVEGSDVRAGQVLYQIDPAPFQAALDNASAALGRSEANLPAARLRAERYSEALADKAVSRQDYDDAAAALKQAEADVQYYKAMVETARINLGYTRITAPISGRIGKSNVTDGALATANQPAALAVIQQIDPVFVDVTQSTTELLRMNRSVEDGRVTQDMANRKKVTLILEDGTRYPLKGALQFRDVSVDSTTGSFILRVVFPNPKHMLLPGMFVRAEVEEGINRQAILIPQQAVTRDPKGNPSALIVDSAGKVEQRMLTLDRAIRDQWLVTAGLAPGDKVIAEGMQKVRPGVSVKVVPFDDGRKDSAEPEKQSGQSKKQTGGGE